MFNDIQQAKTIQTIQSLKQLDLNKYNALLTEIEADEQDLFKELGIQKTQIELDTSTFLDDLNTIFQNPKIQQKLENLNFKFLYYLNNIKDNSEEKLISAFFQAKTNQNNTNTELLQNDISSLTLTNRILRRDLSFLNDLKEIFQANTKIKKFELEQQKQDNQELISQLNTRLINIENYLLKTVLESLKLNKLILDQDIATIKQLQNIFPISKDTLIEGIFTYKAMKICILHNCIEPIVKSANLFPDSQEKLFNLVIQTKKIRNQILQPNFEIIKQIINIFPNSQKKLTTIVFRNPEIKNRILQTDLEFIGQLINVFPHLSLGLENIVFKNPKTKTKVSQANFEFIEKLINVFPHLNSEVANIVFKNPETKTKITQFDFEFIKRLITTFPILEKQIEDIILNEEDTTNIIDTLDFNFMKQIISIIPSEEQTIINVLFQNDTIKSKIEQLDFAYIDQLPIKSKFIFTEVIYKINQGNRTIKEIFSNINDENFDDLINIANILMDKYQQTQKEVGAIFLKNFVLSSPHQRLATIDINLVKRLRSLFYLEDREIIIGNLKTYFFSQANFYQALNEKYINNLKTLFIDRTALQTKFFGIELANELAVLAIYNTTNIPCPENVNYEGVGEELLPNKPLRNQISSVNVNFILALNNFFESMVSLDSSINQRGLPTGGSKFYYYSILELCKSTTFVKKMSQEPNFMIQLMPLLNINDYYSSTEKTFDTSRCELNKTILNMSNSNQTQLKNILNTTFLDNFETFIVTICKDRSNFRDWCKLNFLGMFFTFEANGRNKSVVLLEQDITFANNIKVFSLNYHSNVFDLVNEGEECEEKLAYNAVNGLYNRIATEIREQPVVQQEFKIRQLQHRLSIGQTAISQQEYQTNLNKLKIKEEAINNFYNQNENPTQEEEEIFMERLQVDDKASENILNKVGINVLKNIQNLQTQTQAELEQAEKELAELKANEKK